jgi:hypothetical protein
VSSRTVVVVVIILVRSISHKGTQHQDLWERLHNCYSIIYLPTSRITMTLSRVVAATVLLQRRPSGVVVRTIRRSTKATTTTTIVVPFRKNAVVVPQSSSSHYNSTCMRWSTTSSSSTTPTTTTAASSIQYPIVPKQEHGPYQEYSVIHTDRSLNLMSKPFGTVMRDLHAVLTHTYQAHHAVIIPGYVVELRYVVTCVSCVWIYREC